VSVHRPLLAAYRWTTQMTSSSTSPLDGYELERAWAARKLVTQRTAARYRRNGRLDYLEWGGRIWISTASGEELLRSRVKRRNPPRTSRKRRPAPDVTAAA
jgi:hypothetical protein